MTLSDWPDSIMAAVGEWGARLLYAFVIGFCVAGAVTLSRSRASQRRDANKRREEEAAHRREL